MDHRCSSLRRYPLFGDCSRLRISRLVQACNILSAVRAVTSRREPFLPLFVGDFLAATAEWSGEEQSLYLLLLSHQWTIGSLPADREKLIRLCRWNRTLFLKCWPTVEPKFPETDGRLYNQRLEEHRAHAAEVAKKRAQNGSKGAAKTNGKKSANAAANAEPVAEILYRHQSINQYSEEDKSSSGASAPPLPSQQKPPTSPDPRKQLFDLGKTILGEKSGGLISQAISRTSEAEVGKVLGQMALKPTADPKAYFAAATTPKERQFVC